MARWGEREAGVMCSHGCTVPGPDHPVSVFMNGLCKNSSWVTNGVQIRYKEDPEVWLNASYRKMAVDILLSMGTNALLVCHDVRTAKMLAKVIVHIENHDGSDHRGCYDYFFLATMRARLPLADLSDSNEGGEREAFRLYARRINCSCLDQIYYEGIKKSQPKRSSLCEKCGQTKCLSSLMVCTRCGIVQYCGRSCQVADWPKHRELCDAVTECMETR